jgi:Flp pilus assembly protein protease CpaA
MTATTEAPATLDAPAGQSLLISCGVALVIAGCLVLAHERAAESVPGFWGAAAFLVVIAQQDTLRRKIPNWATGLGLLAAVVYQLVMAGGHGLLLALLGALIPFVLLLGPYAVGVLGAGDVKAFMVLGALWGASASLHLIPWSILISGVMGGIFLLASGELFSWIHRWARILGSAFPPGGFRYDPPSPGSAAATGIPYGTAIGLAAAAYLTWGGLW